jgi:hypothetical protein
LTITGLAKRHDQAGHFFLRREVIATRREGFQAASTRSGLVDAISIHMTTIDTLRVIS